ncbi:hypothetical protein [Streptomyces sp. NPDC055134]
MEPSTLGLTAVRSIGKIGSAALSRYKPVGVARIGSAEDRAQAYKRLLDALVHHQLAGQYAQVAATRDGNDPMFVDSVNHVIATAAELLSALAGVQLCAPEYVIDAAQEAVDAAQYPEGSDLAAYKRSQVAFLDAARYDLEYSPKRWQVWTRRKAQRYATATRERLMQRTQPDSEGQQGNQPV